MKIKNPAYVAAHHLRGEGLTEKRVLDLIIMNETDEYLSIFPEDKVKFDPYMTAYSVGVMNTLNAMQVTCADTVRTQKEFAILIKDKIGRASCRERV